MSAKQNITDLMLINYLVGEASRSECTEVENWIAQSDENKAYFESFKSIWDATEGLEEEVKTSEEEAWHRLESRMPKQNVGLNWQRTALGIAASLLLLVTAFWFWGQSDEIKTVTPNITKVDTSTKPLQKDVLVQEKILPDDSMESNALEPEEKIVVQVKTTLISTDDVAKTQKLEDKSVITLNRKSSVRAPEKFDAKERRVALKGEAFFDIEPDKTKPFYIETQNDVVIRVVGTSFNVKSFEEYTEVIVESGIVELDNGTSNIRLRKNQRAKIYKNQKVMKVVPSEDDLYKYYRTKFFECDDTPLRKLVEVLNEAYDEKIVIQNESLKELRLNARFDNVKLKVLMEVLSETFEFKIKKRKGVYLIY